MHALSEYVEVEELTDNTKDLALRVLADVDAQALIDPWPCRPFARRVRTQPKRPRNSDKQRRVIWHQVMAYSVGSVSKRYRVRITVLKRFKPREVFVNEQVRGSPADACSVFTEGEEFTVDESGRMPEGFCTWAWDDIYKIVTTLRFGGDFPWFQDPGVSVNCCTDGLRPVIFRLERI